MLIGNTCSWKLPEIARLLPIDSFPTSRARLSGVDGAAARTRVVLGKGLEKDRKPSSAPFSSLPLPLRAGAYVTHTANASLFLSGSP